MCAANVESFTSWSTTLTNNQPTSTDTADIVSDLTKIQAEVRKYVATKGADIASATTVDLSAATGNYLHITGTTTIEGFGTVSEGIRFTLVFDGILTLTHNDTSLILPNGSDITTVAGDRAEFVSLGSGNWRCLSYTSKQFMRDYASVKDYGATGDGTTDDAAAFNLAIAAINAGTITYLHIPAGTYVIGSALTAITADDWTIAGDGNSSTLVIKTTASPNTLSTFFTIGTTVTEPSHWRISYLHLLNENTATMGTDNPFVITRAVTGYIDHVFLEDTCGFVTLGTSTTDCVAKRVHLSDFRVELYGAAAGTCFDIVQAYGCYYSTGLVTAPTDGADFLSIHIHPSSGQLIDSHKWNRVEFNYPGKTVKNLLKLDATDGIIINQWFSDCVFDHANDSCIWFLIDTGAGASSRMNNIFFNSCRSTCDTSGPVLISVNEAREITNLEFNGGVLITEDDPCVRITQTTQDVFSSWIGVAFQDTAATAKPAFQSDLGNCRIIGCKVSANSPAGTTGFTYGVAFTGVAQDFIVAGNDFNVATIADVDVSTLATTGQDNKIIANNIALKRAMPAAVQTTDSTATVLMSQALTDESTYHIRAIVSGVKSDGTDRATYEIAGTFYRTAAGNATQQGTTTVIHSAESNASWACAFTISTTTVRVLVTGIAATTIDWVGKMELTQVA